MKFDIRVGEEVVKLYSDYRTSFVLPDNQLPDYQVGFTLLDLLSSPASVLFMACDQFGTGGKEAKTPLF